MLNFEGGFCDETYIHEENIMLAIINTSKGEITIQLEHEKTPVTVANFIGLAEGLIENSSKKLGEPYFNGIKFHRVIQDFMIQGGDPTGTGRGGHSRSCSVRCRSCNRSTQQNAGHSRM